MEQNKNEQKTKKKKIKQIIFDVLYILLINLIVIVSFLCGYHQGKNTNKQEQADSSLVIQPKSNRYVNYGSQYTFTNETSITLLWISGINPVSTYLEPGDYISYNGGAFIAPQANFTHYYVDLYQSNEYWMSVDIGDGYNTTDSYSVFSMKDTPYLNPGTYIPLLPQTVSTQDPIIEKYFPNIGSHTSRSKYLLYDILPFYGGRTFKLSSFGYTWDADTELQDMEFDKIYAVYVHSYRVQNLQADTYHDAFALMAYNTTSKTFVCFASNIKLDQGAGSHYRSGGYTYINCHAFNGFMTTSEHDTIFFQVNRSKDLGACVMASNADGTFTGIYIGYRLFLDSDDLKLLFNTQIDLPIDITPDSWVAIAATLIKTSLAALVPIFGMMILPGVTLGFLFFLPFFLTLFIVIVRMLKK